MTSNSSPPKYKKRNIGTTKNINLNEVKDNESSDDECKTPDSAEQKRRSAIIQEVLGIDAKMEAEAEQEKQIEEIAGALVQTSIENDYNSKTNVLRNTRFIEKMQTQISDMQKALKVLDDDPFETSMQRKKLMNAIDPTSRLSSYSANLVREEFQKPQEERDYSLILEMVNRLKFFQKFIPVIQERILRIATHLTYESDEAVINQGEVGDMMFVIINGSVTVLIKSEELGGHEVVVNTLYEGDSFGEISIISTAKNEGKAVGRMATWKAAEKSDMLMISQVHYQEIFLNQIQASLDDRLNFFQSLPVFAELETQFLVPLATNIEPNTYAMNEVILENGQMPEGLYVIKSGECQVFTDICTIRPKQGSKFQRKRITKNEVEPFRTGVIRKQTHFNTFKQSQELRELIQQEEEAKRLNRGHSDKYARTMDKLSKYLYKAPPEELKQKNNFYGNRMVHAKLARKDFFGGRALLRGEPVKLDSEIRYTDCPPSKFTVVANSAHVEIFIIKKSHLSFLAFEVQQLIRKYVKAKDDIDCPSGVSVRQLLNDFKQWEKDKADLMEQIHRVSFIERNSSNANEILFR